MRGRGELSGKTLSVSHVGASCGILIIPVQQLQEELVAEIEIVAVVAAGDTSRSASSRRPLSSIAFLWEQSIIFDIASSLCRCWQRGAVNVVVAFEGLVSHMFRGLLFE